MVTKSDKYKKETKLLIEKVYEILNQKEVIWDKHDEELYSLLERVIFLKARESSFKDFFDNMESVIEAASRLDFSKRVPMFDASVDKRNIFNYAVMVLNIIVEKMETSVVSMKAINTMLSTIPETIMIVTDNKGIIRFVNDLGEKTLGLNKNEYLGKSVYLLIDDHNKISKEFSIAGELLNRRVNLIVPNKEKNIISVFLTIPTPYKDKTEIEEIVYSITLNNQQQKSHVKEFDLSQEMHDKVAPLNSILAAASLLKKAVNKENKIYVDAIIITAQKVKTDTTDALNAINSKYDNFSEKSFISIAEQIEKVIYSLTFNEGFNKIKFGINVAYKKDFYISPKLLHSVFQNLISNAIKYRSNIKPFIKISVTEHSNKGLLITIRDNGIGISAEGQKKLFDKAFQVNESNVGHGVGLYLVKESVERMNGSVKVQSKLDKGTTFIIQIPFSE
jgi:signal transduction histidine kinase